MKKTYNILFCVLVMIFSLLSVEMRAEGVGEWKFYTCFNSIETIQSSGSKVYVQSSGSLYSYNINDNSIDLITRQEGLSDVTVSKIAWCPSAKALVITYDNSNVDLLYQNGDVVNIADIYQKQINYGKKINNITINGKFAYLSTEFGIVKIDVKAGYISDTYVLQKNVNDVVFTSTDAYVLTQNSIQKAKLTDNLFDKTVWKDMVSVSNTGLSRMLIKNGKLLVCMQGDVCSVDLATSQITKIVANVFKWTSPNSNTVLFGDGGWFAELYDTQDIRFYTNLGFSCTYLTYDATNKCYWGNNASGMLTKYVIENDDLVAQSLGVGPDGPAISSNYHIAFADGKLYVTGGMWSSMFGQFSIPGRVMVLKDDTWSELECGSVPAAACGRYNDVNAVAVDPRDSEHVFVASFNGLFEFRNGKFVKYYGQNEGLVTYDENTAKPYHVICTTLTFDSAGNLWVLNSYTRSPLFCITAAGELKHITAVSNADKMYFYDSEGVSSDGKNVWWGNDRTTHVGIYRYNIAENKFYSLNEFYNQDNTALSISNVFSTAKDYEGNVWIGTNAGPFYIKPEDYDAMQLTQHKVSRNDGTNLADYLLKDIVITKVLVDPGNRKWFATWRDGIYLISSDNNTQLAHFTKENSALPSNNVYDIVLDGKSGRLYASTDNGLCSYQTGVTESTSTLDSDNVYAYPNPVTPDYTGMITVVGLKRNCDVKIVSVAGDLVNSGTSTGGSYTWNGCNQNGERVASGVYMVLVSSSDAEESAVCKIAVVR